MEEIINKLKYKHQISVDESFILAQSVSKMLNNRETQDEGNKIIIYVAENWEYVPEGTKEIWGEIVESVGFYPYLKKLNLNSSDLGNQLRTEYHYSANLNKYFHEGQRTLYDLILSGKNVVASAPTSFGKSLLIEEIVASKKYKNIVIIQPTLALLDETRQKLNKYKDLYKIIVRTTQEFDTRKGNIFLLTAERVLEYNNLPSIDFLILDEFYKLSNLRGDNRSNVLNNAFLKVMSNRNCQFYLLGPKVDKVSQAFLQKYNAELYQTNYTLVSTETIDKFNEVEIRRGNKVKEEDLFKILDGIEEQTLIFCSSPQTARNLAFSYSNYLFEKGHNGFNKLPLIEWINENISWGWSLSKCLSQGIGVHDGSMPKHISASTIKYFNNKKLKYLFCTNTIIEGVNTSAKNVIFYDDHIGTKAVDYFDYLNIKGRSGRLMEHYVGRIINLKKPPEQREIIVDIPLVDQNPIDSEVLINLDEENVKPINDNKQRYTDFKKLDPELQLILKRNAVSIEGQLNILKQLELDVNSKEKYKLINWSTVDRYLHEHIQYILDLCWENLATEDERKAFGPKDWIRNKIVSSCYGDKLGQIIENDVNYQLTQLAKKKGINNYMPSRMIYKQFPEEAQKIVDNTIEKVFGFQKNWQQYRAPKWINVIDSLQKYVCKKRGRKSGDYSYVAEMIENSFVEPEFRILLEYGLPQNAVEIIQGLSYRQKLNLKDITEDEIILFIKQNLDVYEHNLKQYEFEILCSIF